jgi:thiol:disulfide interchange protein
MGEDMNTTVTGCFRSIVLLFVAAIVLCGHSPAQSPIADSPTGFAPLEQWKSAIVAGDAAALQSFYSTDPAAQVRANGVVAGADADVNFWLGLKARSVKAEIREAETRAATQHKRVLLVFGANWCFDCHVLDLAFQRPDLAPIVNANYEVVHVDIGDDSKKNADIAQEFRTTLDQGVPVLAVAESDGKVVYSQKEGEFEDARALTPQALADFLNKWKP